MSVLIEYFEALERLRKGAPLNVPNGTKITNDAVALEAGRSKGSIKRGREVFGELIEAIDEAASKQGNIKLEDKVKIAKAREKTENYRALYEQSLGRELMLIERIDQLETELRGYRSREKKNLGTDMGSLKYDSRL